jgi:hypothetical protein
MTKKIKITRFKVLDRVYATKKSGVGFTCVINGKSVTGVFQSISGDYVYRGMDIDQVKVEGKTVQLCVVESGGYRYYEIAIQSALPEKEKQPKNLSFTGPYYDTSIIGKKFAERILRAYEKNLLSVEFKEAIGVA